jgi:hypothetical protein
VTRDVGLCGQWARAVCFGDFARRDVFADFRDAWTFFADARDGATAGSTTPNAFAARCTDCRLVQYPAHGSSSP